MSFGLFIHRADSIYDDSPAEQYQFPAQYLSRAKGFVGDWIIYYEPQKVADTRGYFAVARVQQIIPDPKAASMYIAVIEPGSYQEFAHPVPFNGPDGVIERGILNEHGRNSGRAQSAVRPISAQDFNRILDIGLADDAPLLPRVDMPVFENVLQDERMPFAFEQERERIAYYSSRIVRDRIFRKVVLRAYDSRCALTGLKLINGGGRAEVEAAHIRPVEKNGPDSVNNGVALCGTMHWMFDRGLISLADDLKILVSRHVNDRESVDGLLHKSGYAQLPLRSGNRPHPHFLQWHRDHCFKH